jgi:hypothetical protein
MRCCSFRRALAMIVAVALMSVVATPLLLAGASARLQGRVLDADGMTPMSGVVVNLLDAKSRTSFPSRPTNERGVFEAAAPAGTYRIVAETSRGAYLASGPVKLRDGRNAPLSLTLRQAAPGDTTPPPPPSGGKSGGELKPWAKWTIVGGIVVGGLLVINSVTSDESAASGF